MTFPQNELCEMLYVGKNYVGSRLDYAMAGLVLPFSLVRRKPIVLGNE